jgi:Flp pilus assembly protein TadG
MMADSIQPVRGGRRQRGIAALELALMLPIIVVLFMGLVDIARGIQANMILINVGREAANLASRPGPMSDNMQTIMKAVTDSAPPLNMNQQGMIYITRIVGQKTGTASTPTRTIVDAQFRWDDAANNRGYRVSGYAPLSKVWSCGNWAGSTGGSCTVPSGSNAPVISLLSNQLVDGQVAYVVEVFYKFNMVFSPITLGSTGTGTLGPDLYSMSVF